MASSPVSGEAPRVSGLARSLRMCCCRRRMPSRFSDLRASESGELTQALVGDKQTTSSGVNSSGGVDGGGVADGVRGRGEDGGRHCDRSSTTTTTVLCASVSGNVATVAMEDSPAALHLSGWVS
ncbi:hypothetical protein ACOMHN_033318 [Nucella lapillus]